MQQQTSTTADARVQVGNLLIDRAHHHRLVEVIHIPDDDHVRLRPVRESTHHAARRPASALAFAARARRIARARSRAARSSLRGVELVTAAPASSRLRGARRPRGSSAAGHS